MVRIALYLLLGVIAISAPLGCDKLTGSGDARPSKQGPSKQVGSMLLDGKADDWTGIEPLWVEAGQPGQGTFGDDIDIKQVYFTNSGDHLYIFLRTTPTVQERFDKQWSSSKQASGGRVCELYFDTDNDQNTGCKGAVGHGYGDINGYEIMMSIPLCGWVGLKGAGTYVNYTLHQVGQDGGFSWVNNTLEQSSDEAGSLIAHGQDGIELAIPLKALGLHRGMIVRLLLSENAHIFEKEGFNEGSLVIK